MASQDEVVARLHESKPPATDSFTYLTIVEKSLSPEILPALRDILDDAELTSEIGWDMVEMLLAVPGSGECLERIARLGNPREVIIKILEILDRDAEEEAALETADDDHTTTTNKRFTTLVGMLRVLHKRLRVKRPSRFVHTTLQAVADAYDPRSAEATQAVIDLARSLGGKKRPALPTRQSSTTLETPFRDADAGAPDPEAAAGGGGGGGELAPPSQGETRLCERLVLSFVTCVLERFAAHGGVCWAGRLLEFTWPDRIVPGKVTMLQAYKEVPALQAKDALAGQLVAIAGDLGLAQVSEEQMAALLAEPIHRAPLRMDDVDPENTSAVKLATGGVLCLMAYWVFATDIFDARHRGPQLAVFPDVHRLFAKILGGEGGAMETVQGAPGTVEALVAIAIHSVGAEGLAGGSGEAGVADEAAEGRSRYMALHHLLTLVAVSHPDLTVRNAATTLAGLVLHADPSPGDRLAILEDLLENCEFATLQACAVTWLREELMAARGGSTSGSTSSSSSSSSSRPADAEENPFAQAEAVERLQYALFPSLGHLADASGAELGAFWAANAPFLAQAANFAVFLMAGEGWAEQTPCGMRAAVGARYVAPLLEGIGRLEAEAQEEEVLALALVRDTLERVAWP